MEGRWESHFRAVVFDHPVQPFHQMRFLFAFLLFFGGTSKALTQEEIRAEIKAQAAQRHPRPPVGFWENLGPEALPVLKKMIQEETSLIERTWLIEGLGHFNDPEVASILESQIKNSANDVFKKKLLSSLILSQGDSAYEFVQGYLSDPNPHVRIAVARGMRFHMKSEKSRERVSKYLEGEKENWIRDEIGKKMARVEKSDQRMVRTADSEKTEAEGEKSLDPLPEKDWVGEWKGTFLTPESTGTAKLELVKEGPNWKGELRLPRKKRIQLKGDEFELRTFQTNHYHWIQVKVKKTDTVFTGSRKTK